MRLFTDGAEFATLGGNMELLDVAGDVLNDVFVRWLSCQMW
jgi:hypothetical protein